MYKFEDDGAALRVLDVHFEQRGGVFRRKDLARRPTPEEEAAIDYLFYEWDYAYEHEKAAWSMKVTA